MEALARFALRLSAAAALLISSSAPGYSATASTAQRAQMATAIANEIRDNGPGSFKTKDVELGQVAIERPWAIAFWRSGDGNAKGQVIFRYLCDSWNVAGITSRAFNAKNLAAHGVPSDKAAQLLADLSQSPRDVAYTKVGQPGSGC